MRHGAFAWCAAVLFIAAQQGAAQSNLPVPKREEETQTRELDVPLPEYLLPGSRVRFPTSWTTNSIFVDHKTLCVTGDGSMPDGRREILKNIESGGRERVRGLPD